MCSSVYATAWQPNPTENPEIPLPTSNAGCNSRPHNLWLPPSALSTSRSPCIAELPRCRWGEKHPSYALCASKDAAVPCTCRGSGSPKSSGGRQRGALPGTSTRPPRAMSKRERERDKASKKRRTEAARTRSANAVSPLELHAAGHWLEP